jgi:RNA polymerase sigma-70 factor, ECF subfamily
MRPSARRTSVGRAAGGAAAARVAELYTDHGQTVLALCRSHLRDPGEAEDATQQTFLSAQRALANGSRPREPAAWLVTIARNECIARVRSRVRRAAPTADEPSGHVADAHSAALRREQVTHLREALESLPAQQRDAILLREVRGLSYDEVAETLDVSKSAVESLLFRARRGLQVRLRDAAAAISTATFIGPVRDLLSRLVAGGAATPVAAKAVAVGVGLGTAVMAGGAVVAQHEIGAGHATRAARVPVASPHRVSRRSAPAAPRRPRRPVAADPVVVDAAIVAAPATSREKRDAEPTRAVRRHVRRKHVAVRGGSSTIGTRPKTRAADRPVSSREAATSAPAPRQQTETTVRAWAADGSSGAAQPGSSDPVSGRSVTRRLLGSSGSDAGGSGTSDSAPAGSQASGSNWGGAGTSGSDGGGSRASDSAPAGSQASGAHWGWGAAGSSGAAPDGSVDASPRPRLSVERRNRGRPGHEWRRAPGLQPSGFYWRGAATSGADPGGSGTPRLALGSGSRGSDWAPPDTSGSVPAGSGSGSGDWAGRVTDGSGADGAQPGQPAGGG